MIRGIIFDCFGVLYQGSMGHLRDYTDEKDLPELINLNKSSDYGYLSREEYIEQVGKITHKSPVEIEAIMRASHIRNQALMGYVQMLHPQYKVGMLSNVGRGLIDQLFTPQELETLFDAVVLSSEVGMIKPDPEIYRHTAEKLGLSPDECVMIDDLPENIDGAMAIGMQGIVFTTTKGYLRDIKVIINDIQ